MSAETMWIVGCIVVGVVGLWRKLRARRALAAAPDAAESNVAGSSTAAEKADAGQANVTVPKGATA